MAPKRRPHAERTRTRPTSTLTRAVNENLIDLIKQAIERKMDLNAVDEGTNKTALMQAAYENKTEIMQLLINGGADINYKTKVGTALTQAAQAGATEALQLLIKHPHINLDGTDRKSNTALMIVLRPRSSLHSMRTKDTDEITYTRVFHKPDLQAAQLLIKAGADANKTNDKGDTALTIAMQNNNNDAAELLIQNNANVNQKVATSCRSISILEYAIRTEKSKIATMLRNAGAKKVNNDGQ